MPGCEVVTTETFRVIPKDAELDFTIAKYVRVRCAACTILGEKIVEYLVAILFREVDVMQRNAQLLADVTSVLQVGSGGAIAVVVFPVRHVQRVHVGAGALQQYGSDGRVDAAGEAENHALVCDLLVG